MDLTQILPALGGTAWTLIFFVIALSVIVAIHEYGHYIVGRWSGIHAEVFSLGFGPVIFARTDKHGTVWQIAALPFGGYVKFLGDANAASVGSDGTVSEADMRRTMTGAPLWARAATVAAGPIFNFILAIAIFAGYLMWQGADKTPLTYGSAPELPAIYQSELQRGDEIIAIGGIPMNDNDASTGTLDDIPVSPTVDYDIRRDGVDMTVQGPFPILPLVSGIAPRSAADDAGVRIGDFILAADGEPIIAFRDLVAAKDAAGEKPLELTVLRGDETLTLSMAARAVDLPLPEGGFEQRFLIGINGGIFFEAERDSVGLWTALKSGTQQLWWRITTSLSGLWHLMTGAISSCNLSGPVGIAQTSGSMAQQGAGSFVLFIGILSAAVGLLNLFPIPVLDGGHLVFHAYEAVTRRKPSEFALRVLMSGGLAIIATLMIFALLNDLILCP
ncbi:RIP metalloprotease RseP [Rhodobacteraceae bacterium S2214]|nr:RIP metalloprotease RseP [Rhodobacteraceae bacterium S2214]